MNECDPGQGTEDQGKGQGATVYHTGTKWEMVNSVIFQDEAVGLGSTCWTPKETDRDCMLSSQAAPTLAWRLPRSPTSLSPSPVAAEALTVLASYCPKTSLASPAFSAHYHSRLLPSSNANEHSLM